MRFFILFFISISMLAQDIIWTNNTSIIRTFSSARSTDINNDGTEDIIRGGGVDGYPTPYGVVAIDGLSGTTLWSTTTRNEMFTSPQFYDYNNDNINDVIIGGRDAELRLINGVNGETIWEFWGDENLNPNDYGWYNFYTSQIIEDQNDDTYPDILVSNGGDHSLDLSVVDRPPGHIMIIDGMTGLSIKTAVVPDSNETYMSPLLVDLNNDGNMNLIFGTGGEGVAGNLWICDLNELLNEDLSNAIPLLPNSELGHIAPPSIGDINGDGILDIVTQCFDGKVSAIDGNNLEMLWQYQIENTESSASPILGKFSTDDSNLDVFATIFSGGMSYYNDYYQVLLDGETGDLLWNDSLGMVNFCTPIAFDSNINGRDEVLISVIDTAIPDGFYQNKLLLIDFINGTTSQISETLPGGNIASTPLITDLENNGMLDIVFSLQADSSQIFGPGPFDIGVNTYRLSTEFTLPESEIGWGSYMGTNYDGIYNNGCQGDLGLFAFPSDICPDENNGLIDLLVTGGTPPYTYLWSNGATTEDLENIGPGQYSVTVTDATGACDVVSRELNEYNIVSFFQSPTCEFGDDGMVYFNSSGCDCNTSFCQFIWEFNGDTIAQGDGTTAEETYKYLFGISAGTYTATIIHPDGCQVQEDIVVPEPNMVESAFIQNECANNNDGWIDLLVSPGDSLIQNYLWSTGETTQDIYDLAEGSYSVIISDTLCVDTLYFDVENIQNIEFFESIEPTTNQLSNPVLDSYEIELNNDNGCVNNMLLLYYLGNDFSWEGSGGTIGEYDEFESCNGDWCVSTLEDGYGGVVNLTFTNEGTYVFNTFMNECPELTNTITFNVTENCNSSNLETYLDSQIFLDLNNNLNINNLEQPSRLVIYNTIGKKLMESNINKNDNLIQLNQYSTGIYSVQIYNDNYSYSKKIYIN